jgi:hypothetical protein
VETGMDFQQGMPATDEYYTLKKDLENEFKMMLANTIQNPSQ